MNGEGVMVNDNQSYVKIGNMDRIITRGHNGLWHLQGESDRGKEIATAWCTASDALHPWDATEWSVFCGDHNENQNLHVICFICDSSHIKSIRFGGMDLEGTLAENEIASGAVLTVQVDSAAMRRRGREVAERKKQEEARKRMQQVGALVEAKDRNGRWWQATVTQVHADGGLGVTIEDSQHTQWKHQPITMFREMSPEAKRKLQAKKRQEQEKRKQEAIRKAKAERDKAKAQADASLAASRAELARVTAQADAAKAARAEREKAREVIRAPLFRVKPRYSSDETN